MKRMIQTGGIWLLGIIAMTGLGQSNRQNTASAQSRKRPENCGVPALTSTTSSAGTFALRAAARIASGEGAS